MQVTSKLALEPGKRNPYSASEAMPQTADGARHARPDSAGGDGVYGRSFRARASDSPPQPAPTAWQAPTRSVPWTLGGLAENGLAPGRMFSWPSLEWRGLKQTASCAGIVVLMLLLLRAVEHYKPFLRIRTRRVRAHTRLLVACHLQRPSDEKKSLQADLASKLGGFGVCDPPPAYFESADGGEKGAPRPPPLRPATPHPGHDGPVSSERSPRPATVYIDMPYATTASDGHKNRAANVVIAINTASSGRPCIVDFNVKLNKTNGKLEVSKNASGPIDLQVEPHTSGAQ